MWTLAVENSHELIYTQTVCYTIAACFPFEPLEKFDLQGYFSRTFEDQSDFPELSRSRSWNFQEKKQDFTEGVGTLLPWLYAYKHSRLHSSTPFPFPTTHVNKDPSIHTLFNHYESPV